MNQVERKRWTKTLDSLARARLRIQELERENADLVYKLEDERERSRKLSNKLSAARANRDLWKARARGLWSRSAA